MVDAYLIGIGEAAPDMSRPLTDDRAPALGLAYQAAAACLADAGLRRSDVDGVITYGLFGDIVPAEAVGTSLGRDTLNVAIDLNLGGQAPALTVGLAADHVRAGRAEAVLIVRSLLGRTGLKVGSARFPRLGEEERRAAGISAYPITAALWAQAYLAASGFDELALFAARIHGRSRRWSDEDKAARHVADFAARPSAETEEQYLASPMIADPLRRDDCVSEVDGAAALLVVSERLTASSAQTPLLVADTAWRSHQPDVDMGSVLGVEDLSRNSTWQLAEEVARRTGVRASDCDVVSLYDCFASVLMQNVEAVGLCGFGEAPDYLRESSRRPPGEVGQPWLNPGGGMLERGYVHGMNNVVDAVRGLRMLSAQRRTPTCGLIVSGGMTSGSAAVLRSI